MYDNQVTELHQACDKIAALASNIEAKAEANAVEARQIAYSADRVKHGAATEDDLANIKSAVLELGYVLDGDLTNALNTLRSIRL